MKGLNTYVGIMAFYILLSYIIAPFIGYIMFGKSLKAAGNGFVVGSVASVILWYTYGSKMI
jgi:hypothetical protein